MKKLHILFLSILPALVILFCFLGFLAAPNDPEEVVITQSFLAPCTEYPHPVWRLYYAGHRSDGLRHRHDGRYLARPSAGPGKSGTQCIV